jgi:hypothetical protein
MKLKTTRDSAQKSGKPMAPGLPDDEHEEELLDEALTETFPASDPIAIPAPEKSNDNKPAAPGKNR